VPSFCILKGYFKNSFFLPILPKDGRFPMVAQPAAFNSCQKAEAKNAQEARQSVFMRFKP